MKRQHEPTWCVVCEARTVCDCEVGDYMYCRSRGELPTQDEVEWRDDALDPGHWANVPEPAPTTRRERIVYYFECWILAQMIAVMIAFTLYVFYLNMGGTPW